MEVVGVTLGALGLLEDLVARCQKIISRVETIRSSPVDIRTVHDEIEASEATLVAILPFFYAPDSGSEAPRHDVPAILVGMESTLGALESRLSEKASPGLRGKFMSALRGIAHDSYSEELRTLHEQNQALRALRVQLEALQQSRREPSREAQEEDYTKLRTILDEGWTKSAAPPAPNDVPTKTSTFDHRASQSALKELRDSFPPGTARVEYFRGRYVMIHKLDG